MAAQQRTYQDPTGSYQLPNDTAEHDRLDAQAASLIALMNHKPIHAPLISPKRILDIGCGTGAMTIFLAKSYPQAEVIGIDIAPVPTDRLSNQTPPNVTFIQGDIRQLIQSGDPEFRLGSFDYIFERLLILGITDWPDHISTISTLLKPGGWLECHEVAWSLYSTTTGKSITEFLAPYAAVEEDSAALGLNVNIGIDLADTFRSVGSLGDVKQAVYEFAPRARVERPDLIGMEGQLAGLFKIMVRKMCGGKRSPEEIVRLEEEIDAMANLKPDGNSKLDGSERHRMFTVIGQKM